MPSLVLIAFIPLSFWGKGFMRCSYVYSMRTKPFDKRDTFNFSIVKFPFIYNDILAAPAYGVYISK
jgi:hypothetical protein